MTISSLQQFFLWCAVLNYALLIVWWVIFLLPHQWIYTVSAKAFRLTEAEFDRYTFLGIVFYKLAIILFTLVPYTALRIVA
ncbi:MAG: DUF6868 family protein [Fimbriimonadaceae bacterium]